jgi:pilus assembly protein CpaB
MQEVLVAAGPIGAGESLAEAQAAGRFELTFLLGSELLPGAVSSTSGLDGVALRDIGEGEQITADLFG